MGILLVDVFLSFGSFFPEQRTFADHKKCALVSRMSPTRNFRKEGFQGKGCHDAGAGQIHNLGEHIRDSTPPSGQSGHDRNIFDRCF